MSMESKEIAGDGERSQTLLEGSVVATTDEDDEVRSTLLVRIHD
jgi:hypothetical protein